MSNAIGMKKLGMTAMVLCGAALAVLPAIAQQDAPPAPPQDQTQGPPPGGPHGRGGMNPERRLEMMQKQLNLNADQTKQVKAIIDDGRARGEALRSDTTLSQDDKRAKMMDMRREESGKIRAVLTPDQQTKFDEMQARERGRMEGRGGPGGPGGPGGSGPQGSQPPPPPQQ